MRLFRNINHLLSIIIIAMMLIGVGVWMFCTGDLSDDNWYRHELEPGTTSQLRICGNDTISQDYAWCKGRPVTEWRQITSSWHMHYLHHGNGRLPNMLIYLQNMIPSWVFDLMQVLMTGIMCVMMLRLGVSRWRQRPLAVALALWSIWIVMPWSDQMASTDYMLNYVWSSALNLWLLAMVTSRRRGIGVCVLAAVAAVMHEGFSVPISAGLLTLLVQTPRSERSRLLAPTIVYWVFSLYVIFPPATIDRFVDSAGPDKGPIFTLHTAYLFLVKTYMIPLTAVVMIWFGRRHGWGVLRQQLRDMLPMVVIAVVSLSIGIVMRGADRMIWPALLMMLIICWRLISLCTRSRHRTYASISSRIFAVVLSLTLCAWLCCIAIWQKRAGEEMDEIAYQMRRIGSDLVYVNTLQRSEMPWWLLDIPEFYHTAHPTVKGAHYASLRQREYFGLMTLPTKFKGMPLDSLPPVPGTSQLRGEYPFYYSPRYLGPRIWGQFTLGTIKTHLWNSAAAPPYLIYGKVRDLCSGNSPVIHTYAMQAYPVVTDVSPSDTVWFYTPSKFAASDLDRPILSIDIK